MNPDVGSLVHYFLAAQAAKQDADGVLEDLRFYVDADEANEPDFEHARRVHDWRNYIPEHLRAMWPRLSEEARITAMLVAIPIADREEWD